MPQERLTRRQLLAAVGASGLAGCLSELPPTDSPSSIPFETAVDHDATAWAAYDPNWTAPTDTPAPTSLDAEILVENLEIPWDLSWAGNGELFVSERTGQIRHFEQFSGGEADTVIEPPQVIDAGAIEPGGEGSWWVEGGEGGLLGVAAHPGYPEPPLVYAYFTTENFGGRENVVYAFDMRADEPRENAWPIVEGIPGEKIHNGGRIEFGPANYLWITTGDAGEDPIAQDPGSLGGKVLRVKPNGEPAPDNPDLGGGADPRVFTYGHRNPQGISWLPDTTPIITEHGPGRGDEVNVLESGTNYGWPEARNDKGYEDYADTDYRPPIADAPSWAPAGNLFYTGESVPGLQNRFLFGGLIGQVLVAVTLGTPAEPPTVGPRGEVYDADWYDDSYLAGTQKLLEDELGRIRHVEQGPDGDLYAITSNRDGRASEEFPTERDDVLVRLSEPGR